MPGIDRISELPESLLTQILSYLPTKHSVTTTALSTRWKNLWLSVPSLDLDCGDFFYRGEYDEVVLLSFIDRLLPDSLFLRVKVTCGSREIQGLKDRIRTVIQRGTQHLDVKSCTKCSDPDTKTKTYHPFVEFMPLNLYTSKTLVSLHLKYSGVEDPGFVFMPCLKSMSLVEVHFRDDVTLERLLSGCPVLEELTLVRDMHSSFVAEVDSFMRVRSGSLKRFRVPFWYGEYFTRSSVKCRLEIDAPRLEHMTLGDDQFDIIVVQKLTCLFMVDLDISFVLHGISSVGHMIISDKTVKVLEVYSRVGGLIPKFNNLSRLEAVFPGNLLQFLPAFLECCPNLKHLILKVVYLREMEEDALELTDVPQCFLSTLECVELKRIHDWEEEEKRVATYFLDKAAVLKKLTLTLTNYPRSISDEEIFEEVNKVAKRSPTCQILLDWVHVNSYE